MEAHVYLCACLGVESDTCGVAVGELWRVSLTAHVDRGGEVPEDMWCGSGGAHVQAGRHMRVYIIARVCVLGVDLRLPGGCL